MIMVLNKKSVDCDVFEIAAKSYFGDKKIERINLRCFIAWTLLPSEERKDVVIHTPLGHMHGIKKVSVDVVLAKKILAKHFDLEGFHMLYTGNISGTIYFK
jgi:hypothetical protein